MTAHDQHVSPIRSWKQLVVVVVLAFAVPIALAVIFSQLVTSGRSGAAADESVVLSRIQPVGTVVLADAAGPKGALSGEQVYQQVCKACHEAGLAGAHKLGDKAAWAKVIAQGPKLTLEHALAGLRAMPARGGNPDLADVEVERAVVYLVNRSGGNWKEPPAPAVAAAKGQERTGQQVVDAICSKCHAAGAGGAPRIGDRPAWIERVKRGLEPVMQSALRGHSGMPARGGMAELSDVEIRHAVEFMLNAGAVTPAPTAAAPAAAAKADGRKVYDSACVACHGAGIAGAPKLGDKANWTPRLAQGSSTLYAHAIAGYQGKGGVMPPKGGNASLSDAEVRAAVDFMAAAAK